MKKTKQEVHVSTYLCADCASVWVHGCDQTSFLGTAASAQPHSLAAVSAALGAHCQALGGGDQRDRQFLH